MVTTTKKYQLLGTTMNFANAVQISDTKTTLY